MTDDDDIQEYSRPCQNCEYHRKRAQFWRDEAYKQAGHPLPEREWVGLTDGEVDKMILLMGFPPDWTTENAIVKNIVRNLEAKLKEKNT